jgi:hypothetical protein
MTRPSPPIRVDLDTATNARLDEIAAEMQSVAKPHCMGHSIGW